MKKKGGGGKKVSMVKKKVSRVKKKVALSRKAPFAKSSSLMSPTYPSTQRVDASDAGLWQAVGTPDASRPKESSLFVEAPS